MNRSAKIKKTVVDPVCGMEIVPEIADFSAEIDGETYYFCAESCRKSFVKNPDSFLCPQPAKKKGLWGRYLARLEKASGGKAIKCH